MIHLLVLTIALGISHQAPTAASNAAPRFVFNAPKRLQAAGASIRVEAPGYAAPCWADVDGDGHPDLLVGQFAKGKIRVFKNNGVGKLLAGEWLQAGGKTAQVPGVW